MLKHYNILIIITLFPNVPLRVITCQLIIWRQSLWRPLYCSLLRALSPFYYYFIIRRQKWMIIHQYMGWCLVKRIIPHLRMDLMTDIFTTILYQKLLMMLEGQWSYKLVGNFSQAGDQSGATSHSESTTHHALNCITENIVAINLFTLFYYCLNLPVKWYPVVSHLNGVRFHIARAPN